MEKLQFKVQEIEGPLDLILQLLQKHKLNIYDIEISALLEQYMAVMREMRENLLDIASEFLEMASRLVYIKTAMLLPRHEEEERADPREALTGALLEYRACKEAAAMLRERAGKSDRFVRPPARIEMDMSYALVHPPADLARAYCDALGRGKRKLPPPPSAFSGIVAHRVVSVESRIAYVLAQLYHQGRVGMERIYRHCLDRPELVATFLALLELMRNKRVHMDGDGMLILLRHAAMRGEGQEDAV